MTATARRSIASPPYGGWSVSPQVTATARSRDRQTDHRVVHDPCGEFLPSSRSTDEPRCDA